jgi:hypothetical protein
MSLSRFRSVTRLVALGALGALTSAASCGGDDDSCGPGSAPDVGLVATGDGASLTFGALVAGPNGDCPVAGAPEGLKSLTIAGTGAGGFFTLCVSRPDLLARQPQALALDVPGVPAEARIVDVTGTANNCQFTIDRAKPASGTVSATGLCGDGTDAAGFALVVDGALSLTRTCGQTVDSIAITLRGTVAVAKQ